VTVKAIFSRKLIIPTLVIVLGMIGLVRLGFWQLDRLHQKQAYNLMMSERWRSEPYNLNANPLPSDLGDLEFRRVTAQGVFDYAHQILLSGQVFNGTGGYVVVTPLMLGDNRAVLVARGWLPADQATPEALARLTEPPNTPILGLARQSQAPRTGPPSTPVQTPQTEWYRIDIPAIQGQMPYKLDPGYLEQMPEQGRAYDQLPIREEPVALDEGNHLGYAIQWFTFALVLGFGYIMLVRFQTRKAAGLIKPAPLVSEPIAAEPAAAAQTQEEQRTETVPPVESPGSSGDKQQPEPILTGEEPR
jgi:surfeit locus 1 family protein